jgi:hypothetical protein
MSHPTTHTEMLKAETPKLDTRELPRLPEANLNKDPETRIPTLCKPEVPRLPRLTPLDKCSPDEPSNSNTPDSPKPKPNETNTNTEETSTAWPFSQLHE